MATRRELLRNAFASNKETEGLQEILDRFLDYEEEIYSTVAVSLLDAYRAGSKRAQSICMDVVARGGVEL